MEMLHTETEVRTNEIVAFEYNNVIFDPKFLYSLAANLYELQTSSADALRENERIVDADYYSIITYIKLTMKHHTDAEQSTLKLSLSDASSFNWICIDGDDVTITSDFQYAYNEILIRNQVDVLNSAFEDEQVDQEQYDAVFNYLQFVFKNIREKKLAFEDLVINKSDCS